MSDTFTKSSCLQVSSMTIICIQSNGIYLSASGCMACIGVLYLAEFQFVWYLHQLLQREGIRYHPWPMINLCAKSCSYWCFWMHSMCSTAVFVNITLHCIPLHSQHSRRISSCIFVWRGAGEGRGVNVRNDSMIHHVQQRGPKTCSTWKSWRLYPVCPQFIAKVKQIQLQPANKLVFVILTDVD